METKKDLFFFLKEITVKKEGLDFTDDEVRKGYSPYIINRFVSMAEMFLPMVNDLNKYNLPKEIHYAFMVNTLPKRTQYFKYLKKKKEPKDEYKKYIMKYFEVGKREADMYMELLTEKQIKDIIEIYKYGKNKKIEV